MMMLQVDNIVQTFPQTTIPILNGLSLSLAPQDFCVVIGCNGSGKSTLLKAISGENAIDSGSIVLNSHNVTSLSFSERAKYVSSVSQNVALGTIQEMTLLENLVLSKMRGEKARFKSVKNHFDDLRARVSRLHPLLEKYLHQPLSCLSGGQRQMVASIMATLNNPLLLLLDEHCSALDPNSQSMVMKFTANMIAELCSTALMVTHHLQDALLYGNRLIMIKQGKIIHDFNAKQKSNLRLSDLLELFQLSTEVKND